MVIRAWYVEDCGRYERLALRLTLDLRHDEGNHVELRSFTMSERNLFVEAFDRMVKYGE